MLTTPRLIAAKASCVGYAGTGVEIEIRDEGGALLPGGGTGEVHLRGRHMSIGHIDATGFQPLPPDGFPRYRRSWAY